MRVLKLGVKGHDVERWKRFLRDHASAGLTCDDLFDASAHAATLQFQRDQGLSADGIVGSATFAQAYKLGFTMNDDEDVHGPNWPSPPVDWKPLTSADRERLFGKFQYVSAPTATAPERIKILGDWEAQNIVAVDVPQLKSIVGAPKDGTVRINRAITKQFCALWTAWEESGLLDRVLSWNGAFVSRFIRGSTTNLSNHSFGSAFDINAKWNQLNARPALVGSEGSVRELVSLAYEHGFSWGGHYGKRQDGMHFECYRVL